MKRILSALFIWAVSVIGTSAQSVIDRIDQIRSDGNYLYVNVYHASEDSARSEAERRLVRLVGIYNKTPVTPQALQPHVKELKRTTAAGKCCIFMYVRKKAWVSPPAPSAALPDTVRFRFRDGLSEPSLKSTMERNLSLLLTAINKAQKAGRPISFSGISITETAHTGLANTWENVKFSCTAKNNLCYCLRDVSEYNVRDIPVRITRSDSYKGDLNRSLSISFNRQGFITAVRFAAEKTTYNRIMSAAGGSEVRDEARRRTILAFVENYRNYYIEKNLKAIEQIFDNNALIITGRVIRVATRHKSDLGKMTMSKNVVYRKQNKAEYIKNLERVFKANKYIQLDFDYNGVTVVQDKEKPYIYGVTLKQVWNSQNKSGKSYSDEGYLFLAWDFSDESHPQIHVRTWQPVEAVSSPDDIINLNSFRY